MEREWWKTEQLDPMARIWSLDRNSNSTLCHHNKIEHTMVYMVYCRKKTQSAWTKKDEDARQLPLPLVLLFYVPSMLLNAVPIYALRSEKKKSVPDF